jgi:hypothetical protein
MKKFLFFCLLPMFGAAQTSVYHPFLDSAVVWRESCGGLGFNCNCSCSGGVCVNHSDRQYYIAGDTVLLGNTYKKLYLDEYNQDEWMGPIMCAPGCTPWPNNYGQAQIYAGAMRQDTTLRLVYLFNHNSNSDEVLYDFDLQLGDTLGPTITNIITSNKVNKIDSVLVGSNYHKRFWIWDMNSGTPGPQDSGYVALIEGIGSTLGLRNYLIPPFEYWCDLLCVSVNAVTVYPMNGTTCNFMTSGISETISKSALTAQPNPFSEQTTLKWTPGYTFNTLTLYNIYGQSVFEYDVKGRESVVISRTSLEDGVYFAVLGNNPGLLIKLVIIH